MLDVTIQRQWQECTSPARVREQWGDLTTIETRLARRRLDWLGHLAMIPGDCLPKEGLEDCWIG